MSISITTCINNHQNMHYTHMFLRGTYGFNQFFSGSEHYTNICYAYTGNVIIFTFHYKREFLIYIFTGSIYYTIIYWPPPPPPTHIPLKRNVNLRIVLSVICKCFVSWSEVVTGFHLQNTVLEYFWRGGVNIVYHIILTPPPPPPPIKKKCQPWNSIVCDM